VSTAKTESTKVDIIVSFPEAYYDLFRQLTNLEKRLEKLQMEKFVKLMQLIELMVMLLKEHETKIQVLQEKHKD